MKLSRRGFMGSVAGATAGAATSKAALTAASRLTALTTVPIRPPGGPETYHTSTCTECAAGCGTRVRMIGERAVFVGGNPDHPLNRGGLCPRGLGSLQAHYHPDRVLAPRQRAAKGAALEAVDWDVALARIAEHLASLRDAGRPERLVVLHEQRNDPFDRLVGSFLRSFGSPNDLTINPIPAALRAAWRLTHGDTGPLAYDIARAGMVVGFSSDLLDGYGSTGYNLHSFGRLRRRSQTARGRWVQIEPRLSVTGSRADEWVQVRPGTEGTLALGMAYVMIAERLYDEAFVQEHVAGFDEYTDGDGLPQPGFRQWVLENFHLSRVSSQTGVPAESIIRLGRELPRRAPTVAIPGRAVALSENGIWSCWAIHCLNALLGSVGVEGGVLAPLPVPYSTAEAAEPDAIAAAGLARPRIDQALAATLPDGVSPDPVSALLSSDGTQTTPEVLIVVECDPVALSPAPDRFLAALDRIPLVVVINAHDGETAQAADLVLPTPSSLERWDMVANPPLTPFTVCGLRQPVVAPRGDGRHPGDLLIDLARRLGAPMATVAPWDDYEACLRASVEGLYAARRGDVFSGEFDANYTRLMQRAGLWTPAYRTSNQLWALMQERGGWWDPLTYEGEWRRMLQAGSGKFDATPVDKELHRSPAPNSEFPFDLLPFETVAVAHGRFNDMPFLRTLSGPHFDGPMHAWVELNPETAEEVGLHEGDHVVVESESGTVEAHLRIYEGLAHGVAAMPLGFGRTTGRWSGGWGVNVLSLIGKPAQIVGGAVSEYATRVRVRRA